MKQNKINIILTINEAGLRKFKQIPTFKNLLHPNQLNGLQIGANKLTVNHTMFSHLNRLCPCDADNMTVNKDI